MRSHTGIRILFIATIIFLLSGTANSNLTLSAIHPNSPNAVTQPDEEFPFEVRDNEQALPSIAYNSQHDEYLVVWQNNWGGSSDIYAQRISGNGTLLSWFAVGPTAPLNPYPNDRVQPSVAYDPNADRYFVVWAYDAAGDGSDWDIHGVFVDWNGPIAGLHQSYICTWTTQQSHPKAVYSPIENEFMIVWWTNHPSVPGYISGRRMNASDGTFISVGSDLTISHVSEVRQNAEIAFNTWRNEYLIVYDNSQDIYGSRYAADSASIIGSEFGIATWPGAETHPSVDYCWKNDHYLVAWQNHLPDIYTRFIWGNGSQDGGPLHLDFTSVGEILPRVSCSNGSNQFMVVWQQQYSSTSGPHGISAQAVNTDKTLGKPVRVIAPTSGIAAEFTTPAIAGGGAHFLIAWEHDRAGSSYQDIYGMFVSAHEVFLPMTLRNLY